MISTKPLTATESPRPTHLRSCVCNDARALAGFISDADTPAGAMRSWSLSWTLGQDCVGVILGLDAEFHRTRQAPRRTTSDRYSDLTDRKSRILTPAARIGKPKSAV